MKHNKHSLPFLLACFATAASLAGCTWDSSLYDDFVNKNTDKVITCEGRIGITLPNGVYAYKDTSETKEDVYYCGTYDEIGTKKPFIECETYIKNNPPFFSDDNDIKSYEDLKNYYKRITRIPEEGNRHHCPYDTLSCSPWHITQDGSTSFHIKSIDITFCNACPEDYAMFKPENNGKITCKSISICPDHKNQYYYNNECKPNTLQNCGKHNHNCASITGWMEGTCTNGVCVPSKCQTGYHLNDGSCVADDSNNCGSVGNTCGKGQVCTQGKCSANCGDGEVRCEEGGVVSCADPMTSTTFCGAKKDDSCRTYETCTDGKACIGGECKQISCTNENETLCVVENQDTKEKEDICININSDNADHCGACNLKCSNNIPYMAISDGCINGQCQYKCQDGYEDCDTSSGLQCINKANFQNDPNNCGSCGKICNADEFCNAGVCQKSTCTNQCLSNGTCVNTHDKCGTQCINCNSANNAAAGTCNAGTCTITSCMTGFHLTTAKTCALNTPTACGSTSTAADPVNCKTHNHASDGYCNEGQCVATSCEEGYHLKDKRCEKDSPTACGAAVTNCTASPGVIKEGKNAVQCLKGKCNSTKCLVGYHLEGDKGEKNCVQDSKTACGADATDCTMLDGWKEGECKSGQCEANACQSGFCLDDTTCVDGKEVNQCGSGGKCLNCEDSADFQSDEEATAVDCNAGKCIITECKTTYHVNQNENSCEQDSPEACGETLTDCTASPGVITEGENAVQCKNGKCNSTECQDGYHLEGDEDEKNCVQDGMISTDCGPEHFNCNTIPNVEKVFCDGGVCYVANCKDGYIANNSTGSHGTCDCDDTSCNEIPEGSHIAVRSCQDQVCKVQSCNTTYELHEEINACVCTKTSCSDNIPITLHIAERSCQTDGSCQITECQLGYKPNLTRTQCDCDDSDGDNSCKKDTFDHSLSAQCFYTSCNVQCEYGYQFSTQNNTCSCNEILSDYNQHPCIKNTFKNAENAACLDNECKIKCLPGHSYNKESGACECSGNSCNSTVNTTCNSDKTCCLNDSTVAYQRPNCCSGKTCKQKITGKIEYKCSSYSNCNDEEGWKCCDEAI